MPPLLMENPIKAYDWGSTTAIASLMGSDRPSSSPQAELWMGGHPNAPSRIHFQGRQVGLDQAIVHDPDYFLGPHHASRFQQKMPFLMKVLAAGKPLSIQAHPDLETAREGFAAENRKGLAPNAPKRCFKDGNHKPEMLCAMTDFSALCGFRAHADIVSGLKPLLPVAFQAILDPLGGTPDHQGGLNLFYKALYGLTDQERVKCLSGVQQQLTVQDKTSGAHQWVLRLLEAFPGDMGALAPLFLNLVKLHPGQTLFLKSRTLHAYLKGVGLEIMASSDNVLRGGLTTKYMDVETLTRAADFVVDPPYWVKPDKKGGRSRFTPPVDVFALDWIQVDPSTPYHQPRINSLEIVLCVDGKIHLRPVSDKTSGLQLKSGQSALVPYGLGAYHITGMGRLFKGFVPSQP